MAGAPGVWDRGADGTPSSSDWVVGNFGIAEGHDAGHVASSREGKRMIVREKPGLWDLLTALRGSIVPRVIGPVAGLCAIVDFNKWQATDRSQKVMALDPLASKFESFGWNVREVDGHNHSELIQAMSLCSVGEGSPTAVIAHTVKGKGVSFMEDDNNWHYRIPTANEVILALEELGESGI